MIQVNNLSKTYKVARRNAGMKEAMRSFFNKQYESIRALDNISFTIADGEMVGYIGPNGAGKSSTIKILSGILTPDSGHCVIDGRVPWKDRVNHVKEIGVVFGQRSGLWWDVPVIDSFMLLKDIYDISDSIFKDSLDEMVTLLNLSEIIKTPTRQLSLGQRMRCEVAASLLHRPSILFLDEPTIGLDAVSKIAVRNFILEQNKKHKTTVILTTHDMQDIEAITKRIMLIGKGRILLDGNIEDMKKQFGDTKKLSLDYMGKSHLSIDGFLSYDKLPSGEETLSINGLPSMEGVKIVSNDSSNDITGEANGHAVLEVDTSITKISSVISLLEKEVEIKDISIIDSSIDEVVVNLYKQYEI
jgi:ABC-2 type transport system ATP-binding protein